MPALVTPLDGRGRADAASFRRLVASAIGDGATGVVVAGTTGEGPLLPRSQVAGLVGAAVAAGRGAPVIAGACGLAVEDVHADVGRVADAGASAALVLPPFYFPLTPGEQVAFFTEVAQRSPIPVLAYHIPQLSKCELTVEAVLALAQQDTIVGLKDSSGDLERLRGFLTATSGTGFAIFQGDQSHIVEALAAGAAGSITAVANVRMRAVATLHDAVAAGDLDAADHLQARLSAVSADLTGRAAILAAGVKAAMVEEGLLDSARCCAPIAALRTSPVAARD